jgi:hypothetical protein
MKKAIIFTGLLIPAISGCGGLASARSDAKSEFTFDYQISGGTKNDLWKAARDYFAGAYGDSRSVFRVMDQEDGTIIGKGTASWSLLASQCLTDYHIRFAAKDGKARLQFEIIRGVPALSQCAGWPWPSQSGYDKIVSNFTATSLGLESSLNGNSASDNLKDF